MPTRAFASVFAWFTRQPTRVLSLPRLVLSLGLMSLLIVGLTAPAAAQITELGDHCAGDPRALDLCVDTTDDSIFTIDQLSGAFCHLDSAGAPLATINHPFGAATFPTFVPVCAGIAYNPVGDSLFLLNRTASQIIEVDKVTGVALGAASTIFPPDPTRNPTGLTYDTINDTLWFRDVSNNTLVEIDTVGLVLTTVTLPRSDELIWGDGVAFVDDGGTGYLEVTYGSVFECGVTRCLRLELDGTTAGLSVDVSDASQPISGIARGSSTIEFVACSNEKIYTVDAVVPATLPPTLARCRSTNTAEVTLEWTNHGTEPANAYTDDLMIVRSDNAGISFTTIATLAGTETTFTDTEVAEFDTLQGLTLIYEVRVGAGVGAPAARCSLHTGPASLIDHVQFEGERVWDLAYNDTEGEIYVTTNDTSGLVYVYDTTLTFLRSFDTGLDFLLGIAYNPVLDQLVVAEAGSTLLNRFDTFGTSDGAFTTPVAGASIVALTYDPFDDDFLYINDTDGSVVRVDADDASPGALINSCSPPATSGLSLARGITYLASDTFLATVEPGAFFQFDGDTCFPLSATSLPLDGLGECGSAENAVNGIVNVLNVAFVGVGVTNTVAQVLVTPAGDGFIRGDSDSDDAVDLTDVLHIADYIFQDGAVPDCLDAADANDDGQISISDALYLIFYIYLGGEVPPPPFQDPFGVLTPGLDPTFLDGLGC